MGNVCQTLKLQLARCDLLELSEKKVRLLIIMMDYYDVLWRIKGLYFYSGGKQNQAKKGVKRLFDLNEQGS